MNAEILIKVPHAISVDDICFLRPAFAPYETSYQYRFRDNNNISILISSKIVGGFVSAIVNNNKLEFKKDLYKLLRILKRRTNGEGELTIDIEIGSEGGYLKFDLTDLDEKNFVLAVGAISEELYLREAYGPIDTTELIKFDKVSGIWEG